MGTEGQAEGLVSGPAGTGQPSRAMAMHSGGCALECVVVWSLDCMGVQGPSQATSVVQAKDEVCARWWEEELCDPKTSLALTLQEDPVPQPSGFKVSLSFSGLMAFDGATGGLNNSFCYCQLCKNNGPALPLALHPTRS